MPLLNIVWLSLPELWMTQPYHISITLNGHCACAVSHIGAYVYAKGIPEIFTKVDIPEKQQTYYALVAKKMDWRDASLYCKSLHYHSHPVVIDSPEEQSVLVSYIRSRYFS